MSNISKTDLTMETTGKTNHGFHGLHRFFVGAVREPPETRKNCSPRRHRGHGETRGKKKKSGPRILRQAQNRLHEWHGKEQNQNQFQPQRAPRAQRKQREDQESETECFTTETRRTTEKKRNQILTTKTLRHKEKQFQYYFATDAHRWTQIFFTTETQRAQRKKP